MCPAASIAYRRLSKNSFWPSSASMQLKVQVIESRFVIENVCAYAHSSSVNTSSTKGSVQPATAQTTPVMLQCIPRQPIMLVAAAADVPSWPQGRIGKAR
jgi:hypothetical protein